MVPWQPPSTLAHTTYRSSVSRALPGPTISPHQPGVGWPWAGAARHVRVAGEGMADQHGVGPVGGQLPPGLIGHGHLPQRPAALQLEGVGAIESEELAVAGRIAGLPGASHRQVGAVAPGMDWLELLHRATRRKDRPRGGGSCLFCHGSSLRLPRGGSLFPQRSQARTLGCPQPGQRPHPPPKRASTLGVPPRLLDSPSEHAVLGWRAALDVRHKGSGAPVLKLNLLPLEGLRRARPPDPIGSRP